MWSVEMSDLPRTQSWEEVRDAIWIGRNPYTLKSTEHDEYRQVDVYLLDANLGVVRQEYGSGWSEWHFEPYSALGKGLKVERSNDFRTVVQATREAIQEACQ